MRRKPEPQPAPTDDQILTDDDPLLTPEQDLHLGDACAKPINWGEAIRQESPED